ncbi:hypothetical protein DBY21_00190 [Candidatus Gastranaerophilales bacterium]|nr:MAG: hypothetical protein DBY21_00190 [Candidatus Gastranaerophilales bacterium]
MQIQQISNSNNQTFQGRVAIVGDLSAQPAKLVRKAAENLKTRFKNTDYDLFIKQDYKNNRLELIVAREKDFEKTNKIRGKATISTLETNPDVLDTASDYARVNYENQVDAKKIIKPDFKEKCSEFFKKLGNKLFEIMTDED